MKRISRDQARKFAFDWRDEPLLQVDCGELIEIETLDAGSGFFKSPDDKAIPKIDQVSTSIPRWLIPSVVPFTSKERNQGTC